MSFSTNKKLAILDTTSGIDVSPFKGYVDMFEACARRALAMLNVEDAERVMDELLRRYTRVCQERRRDDEANREQAGPDNSGGDW